MPGVRRKGAGLMPGPDDEPSGDDRDPMGGGTD